MPRLGLGLGLNRGGFITSAPLYPLSLNPLLYYEAESSMLADGGVSAAQGDSISALDDLTANSIDATQSTATHQPIAYDAANGGPFARFDGNNDRMSFTLTSPITNGTVFFATKKGSYAANIDLTAGTYDFSGNKIANYYAFANDLVALLLFDFTLSQSQIDQLTLYFVTKGAVEDYGELFSFNNAWRECSSLTSFPLIDTSSGTSFDSAWSNCSNLSSFPLINTSSGTSFNGCWRNCSSLSSFPLINTSSGTSFNGCWRNCSSLSSFPLVDTSSATSFFGTWRDCTGLTSFPLIDTSSGTSFNSAWYRVNSLTSFPLINTSSGTRFDSAWRSCTSLTSFPAGFFDNWNPTSIESGVFDLTWDNCSSLTPQSVENILTSIDTSGKYASTNGTSGGAPLTNPVIDIDYDGSGLTAATTTAITNLKIKGWGIAINGTLQ